LFKGKGLVALLIPRVRDDHLALSTGHTRGVEVNWDLIGLQFIITAIAVSYTLIRTFYYLPKMPGMLLRVMTSSKLSPEKPPTLLGMPSGGTTLIQTL
jgi:hypothetical protein